MRVGLGELAPGRIVGRRRRATELIGGRGHLVELRVRAESHPTQRIDGADEAPTLVVLVPGGAAEPVHRGDELPGGVVAEGPLAETGVARRHDPTHAVVPVPGGADPGHVGVDHPTLAVVLGPGDLAGRQGARDDP